jgi:glutathione S-transferase
MIHQARSELPAKLKGLHLFGYSGAPCAQQVRFALGEKGIKRGPDIPWYSSKAKFLSAEKGCYISRNVSLPRQQNLSAEYAAIHPNMVVPALVHDGVLHLESMDIIRYLDEIWPQNRLIPLDPEAKNICEHYIKLANELHRSIRYLSFKWSFGRLAKLNPQQLQKLQQLETNGSPEQLTAFYNDFSSDNITPEVYQHHLQELEKGFSELEAILKSDGRSWICGEEFSMADIVWTIKMLRVTDCAYPFERHFTTLCDWYARATQRQGFVEGVWRDTKIGSFIFRSKGRLTNLLGRGIREDSGLGLSV